MADLLVQQRIQLQKHDLQWLLLQLRRSTCAIYGESDVCGLGREIVEVDAAAWPPQ